MADMRAGDVAWKQGLLAFALLGSLAACIHGLAHGGVATGLWTNPRASAIAALALAAILAMAMAFARKRGLASGVMVALLGMATATVFAGLGAVATVLLVAVSACCIGRRIVGPGDGNGSGPIQGIVVVATGMGALSLAVSILSFAPVNTPATYLLLLVLPIGIGWPRNRESLRALAGAIVARAPDTGGRWVALLDFATMFALALRLLAALYPEIGSDALTMHLVIADRLANEGRFDYDVTRSLWAVMPMAADWQFALAHMLGGEPAARLLNFMADALLVLLVRTAASRMRGDAFAGAVAAAVYSTTPLLFLETASLFVENFWALWFVAALVVAQRAVERPGIRDAAVAGFLVGTALAAKVITLFLAPFFLAAAALWLVRARSTGGRMLLAFVLAALVAGTLPYANAWIRTGNPVFPFMNELFQSPLYDTSKSFNNPFFNTPPGWRTLYDVTFHSKSFLEALPGAMGLAWLVLLPASLLSALLGRGAALVAAACAVAFVALVFEFQSYLRYVLPVLPVFAILVGAAAAGAARGGFARAGVGALVFACAVAGVYLTPASNYISREIALPPVAGSEAAEDYVATRRPDRQLARVIDAMQLHKVLWIGSAYIAGADSDVRPANWQGGWQLYGAFKSLQSEDGLRALLAAGQFDAMAFALDAPPCEASPFVCSFLEKNAHEAYENGPARLYVLDAKALHADELLRNGGFDGGIDGWAGDGEFRSAGGDGAVVVSAAKSLSQAVPVVSGGNYVLGVEGRCTADGAEYRAQVNWVDRGGAFLGAAITVLACSSSYEQHEIALRAPAGAAVGLVYASGHLPDKTAEITRVSFRK